MEASRSRQIVASVQSIENRILLIRGHKVMLSRDLAELYGVPPKVLIQAVKRNTDRFPEDFLFRLNVAETKSVAHHMLRLRSQTVTLKRGQHLKYAPYAFTEQGIAMLSSVLRSNRAIQVNIAIMRAFVRLREILATHKDLVFKLQELEQKYETHDKQIHGIFEAIRQLMTPEPKGKRRIGFDVNCIC